MSQGNGLRIGTCEREGCYQRGVLVEFKIKGGRVVAFCIACIRSRIEQHEKAQKAWEQTEVDKREASRETQAVLS